MVAPMHQSVMDANPAKPHSRRVAALAMTAVIALTALLTLYRLGAADVCGFNEAVEGVFIQQMVEHGKLLFPMDNGRAPMYKPPLFHWTATAIDTIAGITHVNAFNLRLPAVFMRSGAWRLQLFSPTTSLGFAPRFSPEQSCAALTSLSSRLASVASI